jgi:hypothetical protein
VIFFLDELRKVALRWWDSRQKVKVATSGGGV